MWVSCHLVTKSPSPGNNVGLLIAQAWMGKKKYTVDMHIIIGLHGDSQARHTWE